MAAKSPGTEELIRALGRSQLLGALRPVLDDARLLSEAGNLLQFHLILDTNIVLSDLHFIVRRRRSRDVEPALKELLISKTIVGYFPTEALTEVYDKCAQMAERYKVPLPIWLAEWAQYRALLNVVESAHIGPELEQLSTLRDPSDAPFVRAWHAVGAQAVITNDLDIHDVAVPVIAKTKMLIDLRDYARNRAVRVSVVLGTGTAVAVPLAAVVGLVKLARLLVQRAPKGLLAGFGIVLLVALLHPKTREFLVRAAKSTLNSISDCSAYLGPVLARALEAADTADKRALELKTSAEAELRHIGRSRPTLAQAIYRVCHLARRPMALSEIVIAVSSAGVRLRTSRPERSVAFALKRQQFVRRRPDGRWELRTEVQ